MSDALRKSAQRVQEILNGFGMDLQVVEMSDSTRTSQEAASAIGCKVEQIAKSLIFKTKQTGKPVLIIASGTNRVNEKKMAGILGEKLERADAEFVLENTGFAIGGIPPIRRDSYADVFMDEDLLQYEEIWAAAGTPHAVFKVGSTELCNIANATVISVK